MRTTLYNLLERVIDTGELPDPVVEFGAARASSQAHLPEVRSLFPGRAFTGVDMNPGLGVDHRDDLHCLGIRDRSVGTALLLDTLEHVENTKAALSELRRCLAPNGVLLLTSHFFFPIHNFPADYWRFTAQGLRALLGEFAHSHSGEAGLRLFPHTVVGLAAGHDIDPESWRRLSTAVDEWLREGADSWKERALNFLPPILIQRGYERYARVPPRRR